MRDRLRLAAPIGLAIAILAALAAGWQAAGPATNRALAGVGGLLTPSAIAMKGEKMEIAIRYEGPEPAGPRRVVVHGLMVQYGALLLGALALATPRCGWRRRAIGVGIAIAAFAVFGALVLALLGWGLKWTVEGGPITLDTLGSVLPVAYVIVPALAATAWCVRYWLPAFAPAPAAATEAAVAAGPARAARSRARWSR